MSEQNEGPSKCSRKTALSIFVAFEAVAFTLSLIALISPSWQYVYLENGRTEHHHGLWLDCKRDYSHEYGRTREYYETLYRLDVEVTPFDHFFLPSLNCVYKFDYYIDTEDLYDHNHDENRLQDDANQHLFLPWKIAALAALGLAILAAGMALLLCICAFCHRTFICASTVLVSIAAFLSSVGLLVFYIWANYQDNNIIKEDDAVYQQYFGWAVYMQAVGTVLHFLASFLGCIATSTAFHKGKAKLVKIEVVDTDSSSLLDTNRSQQFKRSFSAVYKVDSAALRRWEKDYMSKLKTQRSSNEANFKRAASMPNVKKGGKRQREQRMQSSVHVSRSSSNIAADGDNSNHTFTTNTLSSAHDPITQSTPKSALKSALKPPVPNRPPVNDPDLTYEYLPCDAASYGRSPHPSECYGARNGIAVTNRNMPQKTANPKPTSINVYDRVYEHISQTSTNAPDDYEQPNSFKVRNSMSSFGDELACTQNILRPISPLNGSIKSFDVMRLPPKSTLIDDVVSERPNTADPSLTLDRCQADSPEFRTSAEVLQLRGANWRADEKRDQSRKTTAEYREVVKKPIVPPKPKAAPRKPINDAERNITDFAVNRTDSCHYSNPVNGQQSNDKNQSDVISINTFNVGTFASKQGQRSITNLTFRPEGSANIDAFNRPDSTDLSSLNSFVIPKKSKAESMMKSVLTKANEGNIVHNGNSAPYQRSYIGVIPDEVERSVGSSTMLESDTLQSQSPTSYLKEADLRLNLFMNGGNVIYGDNSTALSSSLKESSVTTV